MAKYHQLDQRYFARRAEFARSHAARLDPWFVADNFPPIAGQVTLARFLAISELVRRVAGLPGHFCELGCWHGTNLLFLAKLARILRPDSLAEVIGFDSFEGLQRFEESRDADPEEQRGQYRGSFDLLRDALALHELDDAVQLVPGQIEETLPAFLAERRDIRFSFVYFDTDLYSSTRLGVELLYPRLLKGGVMVFDEYNVPQWPGETTAVHDALGEDVVLHAVPGTRQPTAYLVK